MDKEKEIQEMASVICGVGDGCGDTCQYFKANKCLSEDGATAEVLYNAGYRKTDEVQKETAKEIYDNFKSDIFPTLFESNAPYDETYIKKYINRLFARYGVEVED
ncbi:MAG: hypothetical protein LUD27_01845 [Clostridia bacterium]|nr:hypothetical protein [Clostridia bacterium]